MKHHNIPILLFILVILNNLLYSQKLYEKVIYTVPEEYVGENLKYQRLFIDTAGNFCMEVNLDHQNYYYTRDGLLGPFSIGSTYSGNENDISYTADRLSGQPSSFYYRSNLSANVYGPIYGKLVESLTSEFGSVIIIAERNDSLVYYINNNFICGFSMSEARKPAGEDWCLFNEKGDYLLNVWLENSHLLIFNGNIVDSAKYINNIGIDNFGNYIYSKSNNTYTNISPVSLHYNSEKLFDGKGYSSGKMLHDGSYYFTANSDGKQLIIFKNSIFSYPSCVDDGGRIDRVSIIYPNFEVYIKSCYEENNGFRVIYNGVESELFKEVYSLAADSNGNYAFFGLKDYFLYPVINGTKGEPFSKYGIRARPIHIATNGDSYVYYKTKDSIYVFHNSELFKKVSSDKSVYVTELKEKFRDYDEAEHIKKTSNYLLIGNESYYFINNNIYGPFPPITNSYEGKGSVKEAKIYDSGEFFIIQEIKDRSYQLNYNGIIYEPIVNIDDITEYSFFKDEKGFTFFAVNGNTIYQYSTYER